MKLPVTKALRVASFPCLAMLLVAGGNAQTVPDIGRWSGNTALTQPQGFSMGSPLTLTWGFVPDATALGGGGISNLVSTFDATFGNGGGGSDLTNRPWFTPFASSFNRWSQLSGLSYQYSAADDGLAQDPNNPGSLGIRADVRIGGKNIDGPSGTLAYNYFPNFGEMVIDTADMALYSNAANSYRFLRNVVMHEHGHGIGCPHCESSSTGFLMEPFINTSFDGPQYHDILLAQRGYGDVFEKSFAGLGNDVFSRATSLGAIGVGSTSSVGNDARDLAVGGSEVDFVSIDDQTDTDFFSFSVAGAGMVNVLLESLGQTYNIANQGGTQAPWNTDLRSDLALALYGTDGTTLLSTSNLTGLGGNEQVNFNLGSGGTYYLRVTGLDNSDSIAVDTQFYALSVQVVPEPGTIAALGLGAALLARRRRRKA
jgi:serralysin